MRRFAWASYGTYGVCGVVAVMLGAIMPQLLHHYHVSYAIGGLLVLAQAVGFLLGVPLATWSMDRVSLRWIISIAASAVALAQGALLTLPPFMLVYPLVALNGMGAAALETAVATAVLESFVAQRAIYMSRLEVSFGLGALILPAVSSGMVALGHWAIPLLVGSVWAVGLALWWQSVAMPQSSTIPAAHHDAPMHAPPPLTTRLVRDIVLALFLAATMVYVGLEGSVNNFLPSLFSTSFKAPSSLAPLSASVFWATMVIGRLATRWLARYLRYDQYLWVSVSAVVAVLFGLTKIQTAGHGFLLVAGLGLSMSAIYSLLMVYANHTFPQQTRLVTGAVTAMAGLGNAVFPALFGYMLAHFPRSDQLWYLFGLAGLLWLGLWAIALTFYGLRTRAASPPPL